jgi:uncharacterized membrane protein
MHETDDVTELRHRTLIFAALIAWCGALLVARAVKSNSFAYSFLVWNLFLAVIPAVAAVLFVRARSHAAQITWFAVWLLFLPNAPYIVTDFVHLHARANVPLWFDIALLLSFAGTGLLLGYSSLADVQTVLTREFGAVASWSAALIALLLSGFGIYLGRFVRLNSWDAISNPLALAAYLGRGAMDPLGHPRTIAVTLVYGVGLALGYLAYQLPRLRMNMQSP